MRRRDFIKGIVGSTAAWPLAARAQQHTQKIPHIGWLAPGTRGNYEPLLEEYRRGMLELGYAEGRTIETEYLYADAQLDRLPALAQRLVEHKVDVIVTASTPPTLAAERATSTIPIVFAAISDPIETGVVVSLARPGGQCHWPIAHVLGVERKTAVSDIQLL